MAVVVDPLMKKGEARNIGSDKRGQGASDSRVKTEVMFDSR